MATHDSGLDPFGFWARSLLSDNELNAKSVAKYETLWKAWRGWLMALGHDWSSATPDLIERFFLGPAPGQGGRRPALNATRMSGYTRQRYWRLLRGVYASAVKSGTLARSPVLDVPEKARPIVGLRDRQSQVLEPGVLTRLRDPVMIKASVMVITAFDWWHVRDRAMLALLVDTGITTSELIRLRGMDLRRVNGQAALAEGEISGLLLLVIETSESPQRLLAVSALYEGLLLDWLRQRQALLGERCGRCHSKEERDAFWLMHDQRGPLFVARRARGADSVLPAMPAVTVYYTIANALKKFRRCYQLEVGSPDGAGQGQPYVAKGAAIIRNSVIAHWLQTRGVTETLRLAGLKSVTSLRLPLPVAQACQPFANTQEG
jgi:site-specific recombinase XerD